jgi:cytochrome P450
VTLKTWTNARKRVDERRAKGDVRDCLVDTLLDEYDKTGCPWPKQEFDKWLGEMVEGGADTSGSAIATLLLVFAKYTAIQHKAQAEIDRVCGTDRSPLWSDFDKLPYLNLLIKEGLRWRPMYVNLMVQPYS